LDVGEEFGGAFDVTVIAVWVKFEGFAAVGLFDSVVMLVRGFDFCPWL